MAPPTPATSSLVDHVLEQARELSNALNPATRAYHKIWIEGQELNLNDNSNKDFVDPLYGRVYLPRKFKTAFAIPPLNDIDIFTNDLGFIVIAEGEKLLGYNLLAGGGMGMSHGNAQTFPRLADVIGFLAPEHLETAAKAQRCRSPTGDAAPPGNGHTDDEPVPQGTGTDRATHLTDRRPTDRGRGAGPQ